MAHVSKKADQKALPAGAITLEGVSKRFRKLSARKSDYTTVKSSLLKRLFGAKSSLPNELIALNNFSLEITPGSAVGIIGRNGSGKSTLLKLIAGIYRPDAGRVSVSGKVSALIELGAGFHPEFTGRENIYLGAAMYGMTKREIEERFDSIVRYSELEDSIDDPVRTYSSGMYMRLGFSVAICCDPDILLVDEVLAVGDASFVHRCFDSISEFKRRGKTLILVTHDLDSVSRWCDEAIWLEKGKIKRRGEPQWVIDSYLGEVLSEEESTLEAENAANVDVASSPAGNEGLDEAGLGDTDSHDDGTQASAEEQHRWGDRHVEITSVRMFNSLGEAKWIFSDDETVELVVQYLLRCEVEDLVFGVGILRADGLVVHGTNTSIDSAEVPLPYAGQFPTVANEKGEPQYQQPIAGEYRFRIKRLGLLEGSYYIDVAAHREDGTAFDYHHRLYKFQVRGNQKVHGVYNPEHSWSFAETGGERLNVELVRDGKPQEDDLGFAGVGFATDISEANNRERRGLRQ